MGEAWFVDSVISSRLRIQTRGTLLLGGSAALVIVGLIRVDGAMASLGLAGLIFSAVAMVAARMNLRGLSVDLMGAHTVAAGQRMRLIATLRNRRRGLDAFGIELALKIPGGDEAGTHAQWVAGRSAADAEILAVPRQRGDFHEIPVSISSEFPFGLFRAKQSLPCSYRMLVFPRPQVPAELLASGAWVDDTTGSAVAAGESHGEPRGLRPYRAGDAARSIAWPATLRSHARGGGMIVRELDPPGFHPREAVVLFHSFGTDRALIRPDRFERALSLAWGALQHFQGQGIPVRLVADFDDWESHSAGNRRLLGQCGEVLAKARRALGTEAHEVQSILAGLDSSTGVLVVSDMPMNAWSDSLRVTGPCVKIDVSRYESRRGRKGASDA